MDCVHCLLVPYILASANKYCFFFPDCSKVYCSVSSVTAYVRNLTYLGYQVVYYGSLKT